MSRYKITIEYDGTPFAGWQIQANGRSIQGELARAIERLSGNRVVARGAGRTDAGVHARAQVAHFELARDYPPETVRDAVNFDLRPAPIAILACETVPEAFDARFSGKARHYLYRIVNRRARLALDRDRTWKVPVPLDAAAMHEAARSPPLPKGGGHAPRELASNRLAFEQLWELARQTCRLFHKERLEPA